MATGGETGVFRNASRKSKAIPDYPAIRKTQGMEKSRGVRK
jgi:hypothetical protein